MKTTFSRTLAQVSRDRRITAPEVAKLERVSGTMTNAKAKVLVDLYENGWETGATRKAPSVTKAAKAKLEALLAAKNVPVVGDARVELELAADEARYSAPEVERFPSRVTRLPRFDADAMARDDFSTTTIYVDVVRREAWARLRSEGSESDDEAGRSPPTTIRVGPFKLP